MHPASSKKQITIFGSSLRLDPLLVVIHHKIRVRKHAHLVPNLNSFGTIPQEVKDAFITSFAPITRRFKRNTIETKKLISGDEE